MTHCSPSSKTEQPQRGGLKGLTVGGTRLHACLGVGGRRGAGAALKQAQTVLWGGGGKHPDTKRTAVKQKTQNTYITYPNNEALHGTPLLPLKRTPPLSFRSRKLSDQKAAKPEKKTKSSPNQASGCGAVARCSRPRVVAVIEQVLGAPLEKARQTSPKRKPS